MVASVEMQSSHEEWVTGIEGPVMIRLGSNNNLACRSVGFCRKTIGSPEGASTKGIFNANRHFPS
jgi:hypothetical protein